MWAIVINLTSRCRLNIQRLKLNNIVGAARVFAIEWGSIGECDLYDVVSHTIVLFLDIETHTIFAVKYSQPLAPFE